MQSQSHLVSATGPSAWIVGQAILPAAGFQPAFSADAHARPAGRKAGCSQDWLPHKRKLSDIGMQCCPTWTNQAKARLAWARRVKSAKSPRLYFGMAAAAIIAAL